MRSANSTQFSIEMDVKNELDLFKAENKERIIRKYALKKRWVTNSIAVKYLLDVARVAKKCEKKNNKNKN